MIQTLKLKKQLKKTDPEQNSPSDSSEETQNKRIENLWNAVEEIKAQLNLLVPSSSVNPPNDPKIIIEGKKENNHPIEKKIAIKVLAMYTWLSNLQNH